jgi:hypothetical protein
MQIYVISCRTHCAGITFVLVLFYHLFRTGLRQRGFIYRSPVYVPIALPMFNPAQLCLVTYSIAVHETTVSITGASRLLFI